MKAYLTRIKELSQALELNGYHAYQIKDIIHDSIGRRDLSELTEQEAGSIIECLEEYIAFSQKCKKSRK